MAVLQVTARFLTPLAIQDQAIHLDAPILDAIARLKGLRVSSASRKTPIEDFPHVPSPIFRINALGASAPMCSAAAFCEGWQPDVEHLTKRKDDADIHHRARTWTPMAGPERIYCLPVPTICAASAVWLCRGARSSVRRALRCVKQIGGFRRHGYARISEWDVRAVDIDPLRCLIDEEGRAVRHLPLLWCRDPEGYDQGRTDAPYWHPAGHPRVRAGLRTGGLRDEVVKAARALSWA